MFDLGFGEMFLLAVVLLVVVGPRELPRLLRTVGQGIAKMRRMSWDLRRQSGIDEIIRDEGLEDLRENIQAVRSLARGNVVDTFVRPAMDSIEADADDPYTDGESDPGSEDEPDDEDGDADSSEPPPYPDIDDPSPPVAAADEPDSEHGPASEGAEIDSPVREAKRASAGTEDES